MEISTVQAEHRQSGLDVHTATDLGVSSLDLTLIRPTNYTDDGYPIRTRLGVIRSNTLTQMGTLCRDLASYPFFEGLNLNIRLCDEAIQRLPMKEVISAAAKPGTRSIVLVVGVQTNQFPRAQDIAELFLPHGIPVLIGGFHVSGMLGMIGLTSDLREALSRGIILVAGEVEGGRLPLIMEDVLRGKAEPLYNYLSPTPDLSRLPIPELSRSDFKGFASPYSTIDTGRGCPFTCDFCTIINVQGHTMRCREPEHVVEFVRRTYDQIGVSHCFFTDDNLARNPRWRELFMGLIKLREEEGIPFSFMMQADLAARKMPGGDFFVLAARAGCNQVFFGVESVNRDNLRSQEKFQNQVKEYKDLVSHCHSQGITCHAGYILGLPFDSPQSVRDDIAELQRMGFDSASFYILIPLPGSKDHQRWWKERKWMESDFNIYDSAHVTIEPQRMTREELMKTYVDAWNEFYSIEHMVSVLKTWRHNWKEYWGRMFFFAAYIYASRVEGLHPMNCGFWTVRRRDERRPGMEREAAIPFWWGRMVAAGKRVHGLVRLFFQLEEAWLRSRPKSIAEEELQQLAMEAKKDILDWRDLRQKDLTILYEQLQRKIPGIQPPSPLTIWWRKHNPLAGGNSRDRIQRIWSKWYLHVWNPFRWLEVWIFEWSTGLRFLRHLLREGRS